MTEAKEPPEDSATSKADAMALLEEAEAEAAEAEALAAAARARARAARLRRQALAEAEAEAEAAKVEAETEAQTETAETTETTEADAETETAETTEAEAETEAAESPPPDADEGADDTAENLDVKTDEEATDEEAPDKTVEAAEPQSRLARWRPPRPSLSATAKVAAIVLICVFAGFSAYMVWQDHDATDREQRAANFIAGAKQGVVNMISLDFNRAKEDVQRVLDSSTGQFRDDFQQRAKDFTAVVEQSKVVTQGTVNAAAVESMDDHSASVLVAATSRITNSAGAKDEPRAWRLRVTVTEESGQYKMSKVDFVP
jgi:Mce-associated membrane protein